ncbi:MAG: PBP1A family penicillin-binding protein, partial [Pseudomonadota bacterium]
MNNPAVPPPVVPKKHRTLIFPFLGFVFAAGVMGFLAVSALAAYYLNAIADELPDYKVLADYKPPVMTRIHAANGSLIAEYARERRIFVPINAIPDLVRNAYLSAEDKNFYQHPGIDFRGVVAAVLQRARGGRLRGASTITQQTAKVFLLSSEQSFDRKIKEAILAVRMEQAFTKNEILELYLNEIYLGLKSYGVAAAALNYFGKELRELTVAEVAYLAALPKAPNNYHPFRHTQRAIDRRNWVIGRMEANGVITAEQAAEAKAAGLGVNPRPFGALIFAAEFFAEQVRRQLLETYSEDGLYGGGLSVRTTLDPRLQAIAKKALVNGLVAYDRRKGWRGAVAALTAAEMAGVITAADNGGDAGTATGDWGPALWKVPSPSDIDPWRLAVVLDVRKDRADIGLKPTTAKGGKVGGDRDLGVIPIKYAKWAKPKGSNISRLLKVGDVVYVRPVDSRSIEPIYELMQKPEIDGGIVAIDPHTGRVLALVGGFSFADSQFDRVVQAQRQPGSSFKPFVYAAALDNGYTPSTIVLDAPIVIEQGNNQEAWKPSNYSGKFGGPSTLRTGIERSKNLMTVRLARDIGMPLITEYARRFGIYDNLLPVLSMSLGAGETSLLRMTAAYAMLANGGKRIEPTLIDRIQDRRGRTVWRHDARDCRNCAEDEYFGQEEPEFIDNRRQIVDPHTAYQMTSIMQGVVERGTGQRVKALGKPVAG